MYGIVSLCGCYCSVDYTSSNYRLCIFMAICCNLQNAAAWNKLNKMDLFVDCLIGRNNKRHVVCTCIVRPMLLLRPNDVSRSDFYLWTFLPRTVIAGRRRSGAPSKVYQWLGPRCRHKMTRKHFANRSRYFYRGQKVRSLASILKTSRLWRAAVSNGATYRKSKTCHGSVQCT